eukprot:6201836-Pleurochrysis_carterae.AAC.1
MNVLLCAGVSPPPTTPTAHRTPHENAQVLVMRAAAGRYAQAQAKRTSGACNARRRERFCDARRRGRHPWMLPLSPLPPSSMPSAPAQARAAAAASAAT